LDSLFGVNITTYGFINLTSIPASPADIVESEASLEAMVGLIAVVERRGVSELKDSVQNEVNSEVQSEVLQSEAQNEVQLVTVLTLGSGSYQFTFSWLAKDGHKS